MTLFLQTLKFTLFGILILIPTDKKGTGHTCHSLCSFASSLIYSFCLLPLSVLHLYASCFCSWNRHFLLMNSGPCQEPVEIEKFLLLTLKRLQTQLRLSHFLAPLCSSWHCHTLSLCCQLYWILWSVTPSNSGQEYVLQTSCIQHRYQMLTASFTPKPDCVWLNCEVECLRAAQALWWLSSFPCFHFM